MKQPLMVAAALTGLLPVLFSPSAPMPRSSSQTDDDIAGIYECEGSGSDGKSYHGTVEVFRNNDVYQLLWTMGPGEHHVGFGIVNGDVLAVTIVGRVPGIVAYRIERGDKGSRLVGRWAVPDPGGQVLTETLTKLPNSAKPPRETDPPRPRVRPSVNARPA